MLARLDVDVGCAVPHRLGHDRVHELDDRGILDGHLEIGVLVLLGGIGHDARHRLHLGVHAGVLLDRGLDIVGGRHHREHVAAGDRADVVQRVDVGRIGHRHQQPSVALADRQRAIPAGQGLGEQRRCERIDLEVREIDELEADLLGERTHEVGLPDHAKVDQDAAERFGRLAVFLEGDLELLGLDIAELDEDLAELF